MAALLGLTSPTQRVAAAWRVHTLRAAVAFLAVGAACAVRAACLESLGPNLIYVTFFPAITIAALFGGFGAGIFATILSVVAAWLVLAVEGRPWPGEHSDRIGMAVFALNASLIAFVCELMHRAQRRARESDTAERAAERALGESESRLRLGLRAGETGTWDWDVRTDRVTASDKIFEFHGIDPDTFDGTAASWRRSIHPADAARVAQALQTSLDTGSDCRIEFRSLLSDGSTRWLATTGSVFRDAEGRAVRMMGATIDVTDRKRVEAERDELLASERAARGQVERVSRVKDEFLAVVSHELRTPLNAILGWSQVLIHTKGKDAELRHGLEIIERNSRLQTKLIDDLLDVSRIITGKLRLDVQRVDLVTVIEAAVQSVLPAAEAKEIRLQKVLDSNVGPVKGDPARLQQVLWNLLTNAIKFTPKGGRVLVVLERINSHVEIAVSDSGVGIDPDLLPHVFERFKQGDSGAARKYGGLGLGLAIVKHLVEQHGGSASAKSDGDGRGTTIRIQLPLPAAHLVDDPVDGRFHPRSGDASGSPLQLDEKLLAGIQVLVADDEVDARELVKRVLEGCGATVAMVSSAREGSAALDGGAFDVLISDIGMPEVDGFEFVRRLREEKASRLADVPVLALTAFARPEDRIRAMRAGFDAYVSKPVEPAELVAVVARLARRA